MWHILYLNGQGCDEARWNILTLMLCKKLWCTIQSSFFWQKFMEPNPPLCVFLSLLLSFFSYLKECTIDACNFFGPGWQVLFFFPREIKVPGFDMCCLKMIILNQNFSARQISVSPDVLIGQFWAAHVFLWLLWAETEFLWGVGNLSAFRRGSRSCFWRFLAACPGKAVSFLLSTYGVIS